MPGQKSFSLKKTFSKIVGADKQKAPQKDIYERFISPQTGLPFVYPATGRETEIPCLKGRHGDLWVEDWSQDDVNVDGYSFVETVGDEEVLVDFFGASSQEMIYLVNGNQVSISPSCETAEEEPPFTIDLVDSKYVAQHWSSSVEGVVRGVIDPQTQTGVHLSKRDEQALYQFLNRGADMSAGDLIVKRIEYPVTNKQDDERKTA